MFLKSKKNDLKVQDEINDLYLESIKAKLSLLKLAPKWKYKNKGFCILFH